jgi:hypothetical protein
MWRSREAQFYLLLLVTRLEMRFSGVRGRRSFCSRKDAWILPEEIAFY